MMCARATALTTALFFAGTGCSEDPQPAPAPADACPRSGVVLAAMRDVERDAEGVSYAAFGPLPDHGADFARAAGISSLLQEVWSSAKDSCPGLPAESVMAVDGAISRLGAALADHDQRLAAYAGNDIHLEMALLFDYYRPDAPIEVVRMDAVFLRVGLDAWFDDWSSLDANLASLQSDWSALKASAIARVPTCHRVAGTQSVVDDLDGTLSALVTASATQDVDTAELESDAGLLEIDILELLYDCPPDGAAPQTGLGAKCAGGSDCDAGQVCDLDNTGGRCAPDPASTHIGEPCTTTVDCGTYERDACNNELGDGFPGGYCTLEPCDDVQVCPPGATCVSLPFETPACMQGCATDEDCRMSEGYVCQLFSTTPPSGFGPSELACAFPCTTDDECTTPLTCNVATGRCQP
jgi:hypothetical protein